MATKPEEHKQEQEKPREAGAEEREKPADNADQAKEGMPGYGQPPEVSRKPLPDQGW